MNLKLMFYTHDWAPSVGGVQTIYTGLAKGISARSENHAGQEIEVTLVTRTPAAGMDDSHFSFAIVRQPGLRKLIELIRSVDVLHIAGPAILPLAIALALRKPTVIEHDGYQSVCPNGLLLYGPDYSVCPGHFMAGRYTNCVRCNSGSEGLARSIRGVMLAFVRRWLAKKATVNVAPTRHIGRRIELPRTQIIFHGVPGSPPAGGNTARNGDAKVTCFAYVGRLVTEKGLPVLLHACGKLAARGYDFRLKILGDGTERPRLEKLAKELGLHARIQFVGNVPTEGISDELNEASVVVMPSIWEDVAPLVTIEQMMQGRMLIASDIGGLGELVDGHGLKFPAGDVNALVACMQRVLEDPALPKQIAEEARRHALEAFTEERTVANHVRLYREICRAQTNV